MNTIVGAVRRMRSLRVPGIVLAMLAGAAHAQSEAPPAGATRLPPPVAQALAKAAIPESGVAVYVHEIGAAQPLVAAGSARSLNPASTMKLITTFAGLELLGPAYTWNTEYHATGPVLNEVLSGDLVIRGYGDPKLTIENFWLQLRGLRGRGVREIRGDLVLDRGLFTSEDFDAGRFDDQPTRPYNTGPDALLINFKAVTLTFAADADGRGVRIVSEPVLPQVQIVNNLSLSEGACGDWLARIKVEAQGTADSARLAFSGTYARDCGERTRSYSVLGHRQYIGAVFGQLWRELGGTHAGGVRDGAVPAGAKLVSTGKSQSLSEIVRDINKFSNNVMARQLFLTLGTVGVGGSASAEKSGRVIRQWLAQRGLSFPELVMENGSGLSRIERISAANLGQLLLHAFRSPVMPELAASLPLAAVDGTMRKRLHGAEIAGQAHIKTGSLAGVRAIAGYVLDARGRRMVVVFIANHANAGNAQPVQDALLRWVHARQGDECCRGSP